MLDIFSLLLLKQVLHSSQTCVHIVTVNQSFVICFGSSVVSVIILCLLFQGLCYNFLPVFSGAAVTASVFLRCHSGCG